jgi:hypothetical protein
MKKIIFLIIASCSLSYGQLVPDSINYSSSEFHELRRVITKNNNHLRVTANDNCNNATILTLDAPCINGTTSTNTVEPNEATSFPCNAIGGGGVTPRSSWYRVNSSTLNAMNISITRPGIGTNCGYHIAVYGPFTPGTGCLPTTANSIYCEFFLDLFDPGFHFQINTVPNSDYLIQIMNEDCGGSNNRTIDYCLGVYTVPTNNTLSSPTVIDQCGVVINGTNIGYSPMNGAPGFENLDNNLGTTCPACMTLGDDVPYVVNNDSWFSFCTTTAGLWSIDFTNITNCVAIPANGLQMTIFRGTPTNLTVIEHAPSPSLPGSLWTSAPFAVAAGECIFLMVDGFAGDECDYSYTLNNISGGCNILLPLDNLNFTTKYNDGFNQLKWDISISDELKYFDIQKSNNGINFYTMDSMEYNLNSNYTYNDFEPFDITYYRIRSVFKSKIEYSNITVINIKKEDKLFVYPIPVKDELNINLNSNDITNVEIKLINLLSQTIYVKKVSNIQNNLKINLKDINSGIYYLTIKDEIKNSFKFIKIKINDE